MLVSAWSLAFVVLCGVLCLFFGPIGILYAGGLLACHAFTKLVTNVIVPNIDARNDPVYRANVRKLIARQRPKGRSE